MEKKIITITLCALAFFWSVWFFYTMGKPISVVELGLTEQRQVYANEPAVYLDNKPLPVCSEDIETRICRYSCAPDGACIFIPRELIKKYKF